MYSQQKPNQLLRNSVKNLGKQKMPQAKRMQYNPNEIKFQSYRHTLTLILCSTQYTSSVAKPMTYDVEVRIFILNQEMVTKIIKLLLNIKILTLKPQNKN